jgi:hypothetical protein
MLDDGIHFTPVGTALVGSYVADVILEHLGSKTTSQRLPSPAGGK